MANYTTNLKTWGASGQEFPDGYSYVDGEQPVDAWDNFVNSNIIADLDYLVALTNQRLESSVSTSDPSSPEDGEMVYRTDLSNLKLWDNGDASWHTVLFADNAVMEEPLDLDANAITDSTGTARVDVPLRVEDARLDHDWLFRQEGGSVGEDNFVPLGQVELANNQTLEVTQATLTENGFTSPCAGGVDLIIAPESASTEGDTVKVLEADGSTLYPDETGSPLASYQNTSGSPQVVAIGIDNGNWNPGNGNDVSAFGGFVARKV